MIIAEHAGAILQHATDADLLRVELIVIYRQDLDRHNPGSKLKAVGDDHE